MGSASLRGHAGVRHRRSIVGRDRIAAVRDRIHLHIHQRGAARTAEVRRHELCETLRPHKRSLHRGTGDLQTHCTEEGNCDDRANIRALDPFHYPKS